MGNRFTRVTRNFQITIPKEIREQLGISIGDILEVSVENNRIVLKPIASRHRKTIKLGKKLTPEYIETSIEEGIKSACCD